MTQEGIQQKAYEVYPLDLDRHLIIEGEPYDNNKEKREAYIRGLTDSKPELPSDLDEAAKEYERNLGYYECVNQWPSVAFKAGAEWMADQFHFVTAHCCESSNPASESVDKPLHLITLIYEDDDKNPYVVGGDDVEVCLRKK